MNTQEQKLAQQGLTSQTNPTKAATPLDLMGIIRYVVTLLIVLLVLVFAWRSVKKAHATMSTVRMPLDLVALESGAAGAMVHDYAGGLPTSGSTVRSVPAGSQPPSRASSRGRCRLRWKSATSSSANPKRSRRRSVALAERRS